MGPVDHSCGRHKSSTLTSPEPPQHRIEIQCLITMRASICLAILTITTCASAYPFMAEYNQLSAAQKRAVTEMAKKNLLPRGASAYCRYITLGFCVSTDCVKPPITFTVAQRSMDFREVKSATSWCLQSATRITNIKTHPQAPSAGPVQDSTQRPTTDF